MHVHDYEMIFPPEMGGFQCVLRCRCGDEAPSLRVALSRMQRSRCIARRAELIALVAVSLVVSVVVSAVMLVLR